MRCFTAKPTSVWAGSMAQLERELAGSVAAVALVAVVMVFALM
jgi:hypothetical protein